MQKGLWLIFVAVLAGAGWYFFDRIESICPIPFAYSIGRIDEEFSLSNEEVIEAVANAEAVWEESLSQDLFVYDPKADFTINFIFDERQERSDAEVAAADALEESRKALEAVGEEYDKAEATLETRREDFEDNNSRYEADLREYNETVAEYNNDGGAPPDEYESLEDERRRLERVALRLEEAAEEVNTLTDALNELGEAHNREIEAYNTEVRTFNNTYGDGREFTQGDYQREGINIYTFKDQTELELVLAHELGHALSIDHVEDTSAVMHYLLADKPDTIVLADDDIAAFYAVCGDGVSFWDKFGMLFRQHGGVVHQEGV